MRHAYWFTPLQIIFLLKSSGLPNRWWEQIFTAIHSVAIKPMVSLFLNRITIWTQMVLALPGQLTNTTPWTQPVQTPLLLIHYRREELMEIGCRLIVKFLCAFCMRKKTNFLTDWLWCLLLCLCRWVVLPPKHCQPPLSGPQHLHWGQGGGSASQWGPNWQPNGWNNRQWCWKCLRIYSKWLC